jgi:hypothetical protein
MRTISEALHFVRYHSPVDEPTYRDSTALKKMNSFVSREASQLIAGTRIDFLKGTVLEHPLPLAKMYIDLREQGKPTSESIIQMLGGWPLITVAGEEDKQLEHAGWDSPAQRYADANIEVGRVKTMKFGSDPEWKPISLSDPSSWSCGSPTT